MIQRAPTKHVLAAALLLVAASAMTAFAHGGDYQPPAPKGRGGRLGGGPGTGGPQTGGGLGGPTTGGGAAVRPGSLPIEDLDEWTRWWFPNRRILVDIRARTADNVPRTPGGADMIHDPLWRERAQVALLEALQDDDVDVATGAAVALGKCGDASHAVALVQVLLDDKRRQEIREAAAVGLALMPRQDDAPSVAIRKALLQVAADEDEERFRLRTICMYALGLRQEIAAMPFLLQAAHSKDGHIDVIAAGCSALGMLREEIARPDLEGLLDDPHIGARKLKPEELFRQVYAAHGLARLGGNDSVVALRAAAESDEREVRAAAVMALGATADATDDVTAKLLARILQKDDYRGARSAAATAIGQIGHVEAGDVLQYAFRKGDLNEQCFAALGLGVLARRRADPSLTDCLLEPLEKRGNATLRGALSIALALAGNEKALPRIREIARDGGGPEARQHAAFALGLLPDRTGGPAIVRELVVSRASPTLQREAALALGMLGDREALETLRDLVQNGSSVYVQGSAAVALGRIGGDESAAALVELLKNQRQPGLARGMAAVGLGFLLDESESFEITQVGADLNWLMINSTVGELLTIL